MVRFCVVALVALLSVTARAEDAPATKWYVGADLGTAKMGVSEFTFGRPEAPQDRKSTAFRVRGGYQFIRFFALEATLAKLGSYSTRVDMDCSPAPQVQCIPDFRSDIDLQGFGLFGVGIVPISDRLSVRGTVGVTARHKHTHQVPDGAADYTRSSTKLLAGFGVGAAFAINRKLDVYAEWNRIDGGNSSGGLPIGEMSNPGEISEGDLAIFSLGARWRF